MFHQNKKTNMKTINLLWAALFVLLFLGGCKEDSDPAPASPAPETPANAFFSAKVDGTLFEASKDLSTAKYVTATKMLQVIGQTTDQKQTIHFSLMTFDNNFSGWKAGTYTFDPGNVATLKYLASGMFTQYNGTQYENWSTKWEHVQTGQIVIEAISETHVKGTFHFEAVKQNNDGTFDGTNKKHLTEGTFDLDIKKY